MKYCPFDIESDSSGFGLEAVHVRTNYGHIVARLSSKPRSGIATVYLHGVGADWSTWTPMLRAETSAEFQVHDQVLVDLPGFGDSPNKAGTLRVADVGAAVLEVTDTLGYEKFRVVGHSMGGFLALDMASRYPERIESIHVIAASYFSILETSKHPLASFAHNPTVAATYGAQYQVARTGKLGVQAIHAFYNLGVSRIFLGAVASHPLRLRRSVVKALCYQYSPTAIIQTAANGPGYDADQRWAQIRCPIWAVFADRDRLVPPMDMERFLRCQPAAKVTMLVDSSHLVHIERPFDVLDALDLWDVAD